MFFKHFFIKIVEFFDKDFDELVGERGNESSTANDIAKPEGTAIKDILEQQIALKDNLPESTEQDEREAKRERKRISCSIPENPYFK